MTRQADSSLILGTMTILLNLHYICQLPLTVTNCGNGIYSLLVTVTPWAGMTWNLKKCEVKVESLHSYFWGDT